MIVPTGNSKLCASEYCADGSGRHPQGAELVGVVAEERRVQIVRHDLGIGHEAPVASSASRISTCQSLRCAGRPAAKKCTGCGARTHPDNSHAPHSAALSAAPRRTRDNSLIGRP